MRWVAWVVCAETSCGRVWKGRREGELVAERTQGRARLLCRDMASQGRVGVEESLEMGCRGHVLVLGRGSRSDTRLGRFGGLGRSAACW